MNQESKNILAVIQARFTSSRLPGKVMNFVLGEPMLFRQWERVRRSKLVKQIVVATSLDKSDDVLALFCDQKGIPCFRGSLEDVLDRFYQAALEFSPQHVVRLTGDCPLLDSILIDQAIRMHLEQNFDYTANIVERTFPDGMDVEVMTFDSLKTAWQRAILPSEREHVTPYIYHHPEMFTTGHFKQDEDLSQLRLTVDEQEDLIVVRKIFETLYPKNNFFGLTDILSFLKHNPEIKNLNKKFQVNEGYQKSLLRDQQFLTALAEKK